MLIFKHSTISGQLALLKFHSVLTFTAVSPLIHETEGFGFPIVVQGRTAFNPSIISTFTGGRVILGPKNLEVKKKQTTNKSRTEAKRYKNRTSSEMTTKSLLLFNLHC